MLERGQTLAKAHVSEVVRRLLNGAGSTRGPGVDDPLVLRQTPFFAHTGPVDPIRPFWTPYECPARHADSFGARPDEAGRSKLRLTFLRAHERPQFNDRAAPGTQWKWAADELLHLQARIHGIFDCTAPNDQHFLVNKAWQYRFALAQSNENQRAFGNVTGGPMLAIDKELIGAGSVVGWAPIVDEDERQQRDDADYKKMGLIVAELASRNVPTVRICVARFGGSGNAQGDMSRRMRLVRHHKVAQMVELLKRNDLERPLPTIIISDIEARGSADIEKLLTCDPHFHFGPVMRDTTNVHRMRIWKSMTLTTPVELWSQELLSSNQGLKRSSVERTSPYTMLAQLNLSYRKDTKEKQLFETYNERLQDFEARRRNVSSSMRDAAAAIQTIVDELPPPGQGASDASSTHKERGRRLIRKT